MPTVNPDMICKLEEAVDCPSGLKPAAGHKKGVTGATGNPMDETDDSVDDDVRQKAAGVFCDQAVVLANTDAGCQVTDHP
jgi:hypothetical protein